MPLGQILSHSKMAAPWLVAGLEMGIANSENPTWQVLWPLVLPAPSRKELPPFKVTSSQVKHV